MLFLWLVYFFFMAGLYHLQADCWYGAEGSYEQAEEYCTSILAAKITDSGLIWNIENLTPSGISIIVIFNLITLVIFYKINISGRFL